MGSGHGRIRIVHGTGLLSTCRFGDLHSTKKDLARGFLSKKHTKGVMTIRFLRFVITPLL